MRKRWERSTLPRPRSARRAPASRVWLLLVLLASAWVAGCAKPHAEHRAELEALLQAGQLARLRAKVDEYLKAGERAGYLHEYLGLACLRDDDDPGAFAAFHTAVTADSTLAPRIAGALVTAAMADQEKKWEGRALRRLLEAYTIRPDTDLGPRTQDVALSLFRDKEYARALPLYLRLDRHAVASQGKHQEYRYRIGACYDQLHRDDLALEVYRSYLKEWPDDTPYKRRVLWRYQSILLEQGEAALPSDAAAANTLAQEALAPGWNDELLQRGRVLAARAAEAQGQPAEALRWYGEVVTHANPATAELVQLAQRRIEELRAGGTH